MESRSKGSFANVFEITFCCHHSCIRVQWNSTSYAAGAILSTFIPIKYCSCIIICTNIAEYEKCTSDVTSWIPTRFQALVLSLSIQLFKLLPVLLVTLEFWFGRESRELNSHRIVVSGHGWWRDSAFHVLHCLFSTEWTPLQTVPLPTVIFMASRHIGVY